MIEAHASHEEDIIESVTSETHTPSDDLWVQ
jgi:hypothetical protein